MNTIERMKLTIALKRAVDERNAETNTIAKLKLAKKVQDLRKKLGLVNNTLSDDEIERLSQMPIDDTHDMGQGQRKGVAKKWIRDNLLGKTVRTVDGKIVHFNSADTVDHISFNVRRNSILAMTIPFIPVIFAKGEFAGREISEPEHQAQRIDQSIKAFHLYQKWVELKNGYKVHAQVQACERENEKELFYAGYNLKALDKKRAVSPSHHNDNSVSTKTTNARTTTAHTMYDKAIIDEMQVDIDVEQILPLRILQVLDENGNDVTDDALNENPVFEPSQYDDLITQKDWHSIYLDVAKNSNSPDKVFWSEDTQAQQQRIQEALQQGTAWLDEIGSPSLGSDKYLEYVQINKKLSILERTKKAWSFSDLRDVDYQKLIEMAKDAIPSEIEGADLVQSTRHAVHLKRAELAQQESIYNFLTLNEAVERNAELKALQQQHEQAVAVFLQNQENHRQRLDEKYMALLGDYQPYLDLKAKMEQEFVDVETVGQQIYDKLQNTLSSRISDAEVNAWYKNNVTIKSRSLVKDWKTLSDEVKQFYRMTGGRLGKVQISSAGRSRASSNALLTIRRSKTDITVFSGNPKVLWHELAHNLEFDTKARSLAHDFIKRRRESDKLYTLRSLTGNKGYSKNEVAYKDHFINPYVGKYYDDGATEVFSMGVQYLCSPEGCAELFHKDREMFALIVGYLLEPCPDYLKNQIAVDEYAERKK